MAVAQPVGASESQGHAHWPYDEAVAACPWPGQSACRERGWGWSASPDELWRWLDAAVTQQPHCVCALQNTHRDHDETSDGLAQPHAHLQQAAPGPTQRHGSVRVEAGASIDQSQRTLISSIVALGCMAAGSTTARRNSAARAGEFGVSGWDTTEGRRCTEFCLGLAVALAAVDAVFGCSRKRGWQRSTKS